MAAVVTDTYERNINGTIHKVTLSWTTHTDGSATKTTDPLTGTIVGITYNPGSTTPSDNYDMTLSDEDGFDVLSGQGANLDQSTTTRIVPGVPFKDGTTTSLAPVAVHGTLALSITNAGDTKNGTLVIYLR